MRANLLAAAAAAFGARGFADVSLRDVARRAGTSAAMVHYYFGDKDGLFAALLEDALAGVLARARSELAARGENAGPGASLDVFFEVAQAALAAAPWIPQLVVREVLSDSARFRERFIEGYARPMSRLLRGALRGEVAGGRLRADLDVDLAFVSLLALCAFPFVARPVIEGALDISFDAAFRARLASHSKRLFLEGARS